MADVLLVDDDLEVAQSLLRVITPAVSPRKIVVAGSAAKAIEIVKSDRPLVAVVDLCLDEKIGVASGFELLRVLQSSIPAMRVIVMTGHGSVSNGVRAIQLGAASFLEKPAQPEHIVALIRDAITQAELRVEYEKLASAGVGRVANELRGTSKALLKLKDEIAFAATTSQPVLLTGETGTGKSLCARLIHEQSVRATGRFVHYTPNFGGGDLVQSELFGHLKGAFTGALDSRRGLVLEADGGTLFIDELDAVPKDTQVLLLDLVQEQRIRPLGADGVVSVSCRFIAATNRPLDIALSNGVIRHDLYHRLAHNVIRVPALCERTEDIPELVDSILQGIRSRDGINVFEFEPKVIDELKGHPWPGNVRELQGVVETAAYRANYKRRSLVTLEDLSFSLVGLTNRDGEAQLSSNLGLYGVTETGESFHEQVDRFKRQLVRRALETSQGNQAQAAALLGVDRGTVRRLS